MTTRVPKLVLGAIYLPPVFAVVAIGLNAVIQRANPDVSVATFLFLDQGLPVSALVLHGVGLAVLVWHSIARVRAQVGPAWSMVPAFAYYVLAVAMLVAVALSGRDGPAPIWAI